MNSAIKYFIISVAFVLVAFSARAQVSAHFTSSPAQGCAPLLVNFTNTSSGTGTLTYLWNFGNGNSSTFLNPSTNYINPGTYTVSLTVSNSVNSSTTTQTITVFANPHADFSGLLPLKGCVPLSVTFNDQSTIGDTTITTWTWDAGDASSIGNIPNPTHIYNNAGFFNVSLVVTDANHCHDDTTLVGYVHTSIKPVLHFASDTTTYCTLPAVVDFSNTSSGSGVITHDWNFGDPASGANNLSTLQNPVHVYTSYGNYSVTLTATDSIGCSNDTTLNNFIRVILPVPPAFHTIPSDSVCPNVSVPFINDSDTSAWWNFGDGSTSILPNPTHTYALPGTYYITMITAPGTPCPDTLIDTIVVRQPVAVFSSSIHYVCSPTMPVIFTDQSTDAASWSWTIPGGTPSNSTLQNPSATFPVEGTYYPMLSMTDIHGCTSIHTDTIVVKFPDVDFTMIQPPLTCIPDTVKFTDASYVDPVYDSIASWHWDFGIPTNSNDTSNVQNPTYIYQDTGKFTVTLVVTTGHGCSDSIQYEVEVGEHQHPIMSFTYTGGCANDTVHFISLSTDSLYLDFFQWTFRNDSNLTVGSGSEPHPNIYFHGNGLIDIEYIIGQNGCRDTLDSLIAFHLDGPYFTGLTPIYSCDHPLHLGATLPIIKETTEWYWDMNNDHIYDDSSAVYPNPIYVHNDTAWFDYPGRGIYTIQLIAFNDSTGCFYRDSFPDYRIYDLDAKINVASPNCPSGVLFDLSNSYDWDNPAPPWANYSINYGDGQNVIYNQLINYNIPHSFPNVTGQYNVHLYMTNLKGCHDSDSTFIRIFKPIAGFTASPIIGCPPLLVSFTDTSTADTTFSIAWSYGDGSPLSTAMSHTYNLFGIMPLTLYVTDEIGCRDTAVFNVDVTSITASFSSIDNTVCKGDSVYFSATTMGATIYQWNFGDTASGINNTSTLQSPAHQYADSGKYTVTLIVQKSNVGCTDTLVVVQYVDVQTITADFSVLSDSSDCYPFSVSASNLTDSIYHPTWQWFFGDGVTGFGYDAFHTYTLPSSPTLSLVATTPYGCTDTTSIPIYIGGPSADIIVNPNIICRGDTVSFQLTNTSGIYNVSWDFGDVVIVDTLLNILHAYNTVPASGSYVPSVIVYGGPNGYCGQGIPVDTVFVYQVFANFTINGDSITAMCNPGFVNFTNTSVGPITSNSWHLGDGQVSTGFEPGSPYSYFNPTNNDTTYYISLATTSTLGGCYDSIVKPFTVYPTPQITIGDDVAICYGSSVQLNVAGGMVVSWDPITGLDNAASYTPNASPIISTWYEATIYDNHACQNNDSVFVFVQQPPSLTHSADTTIIVGQLVNMLATSDSTVTYLWSPATGLSCTDCPNPIAQPLESTTYTVMVSDTMNCNQITGQIYIEVIEEYTIDVPSAFTPNGDGKNDLVYVKGWGIKQLQEFKIYNRWGECVFNTDDINAGWDGTFKGIKQNIDTYAYTAKVMTWGNKELTKNGLINLLR